MPLFTAETFTFLEDLAAHNDRDWFQAHKARYEAHVREPALALIRALAEPAAALSPHLVASDRKQGGSLMRVFRDTRFSRDKRPYKTNIGIQLRHDAGKDVHAPGLYLHVTAPGAGDDCFVGAGTWGPDGRALAKIRQAIDERGDAWLKVRDDARFAAVWSLTGRSLKRAPRGYPMDHSLIEDLRRKDHIATAPLDRAELLADDLPALLTARFAAAAGYMAWLCEALELPF